MRFLGLPEVDLHDRMRPRGVGIGAVLARDPHAGAVGNHVHELPGAGDPLRGEPDDVDVLLGVLPGLQDLAGVEQVEQLPTVDLIEGDVDLQGGELLVPNSKDVGSPQIIHAQHSIFGVSVHRVGLP